MRIGHGGRNVDRNQNAGWAKYLLTTRYGRVKLSASCEWVAQRPVVVEVQYCIGGAASGPPRASSPIAVGRGKIAVGRGKTVERSSASLAWSSRRLARVDARGAAGRRPAMA